MSTCFPDMWNEWNMCLSDESMLELRRLIQFLFQEEEEYDEEISDTENNALHNGDDRPDLWFTLNHYSENIVNSDHYSQNIVASNHTENIVTSKNQYSKILSLQITILIIFLISNHT